MPTTDAAAQHIVHNKLSKLLLIEVAQLFCDGTKTVNSHYSQSMSELEGLLLNNVKAASK